MPGKNFSDFLKNGKDVPSEKENVDIFSNEEKVDYVSKEKYFNEFGFSSDEQMPSSPNFGNFMKPTSAETLEELNSSGAALANKTKSGNPSTDVDFMSQMQKMYTSLSQGEEEIEKELYSETSIQNAPDNENNPSSESQPFQSAPAATCDSEEPSQEKEGASARRVSAETDMKEESMDYAYVDFEEEEQLPESVYEELEITDYSNNDSDDEIQYKEQIFEETFKEDVEIDEGSDEVIFESSQAIDALFEETSEEPVKEEEIFANKVDEELEEETEEIPEPETEEDYWNYIDGLLTHFDDGRIHSKINNGPYEPTNERSKTTGFFMQPEEQDRNNDSLGFFEEPSTLPVAEEEEYEEPIFMEYGDAEASYDEEKAKPVVWKVIVALLAAVIVITVIFFVTSSNAMMAVNNGTPALVIGDHMVTDVNINPVF